MIITNGDHKVSQGNGQSCSSTKSIKHPEASAMPSLTSNKPRQSSGRRSLARLCQFIVENQLEISGVVLLGVFALHAAADRSSHLTPPPTATFVSLPNPVPPAVVQFRSFTTKCLHLSYREPLSGTYSKGPDDAYFVGFWVVLFTFLRALTMRYVLVPAAIFCGMRKRTAVVRFAEQAWAMLYALTFWSLGMYLLSTSPIWPFQTRHFWIGYPHTALPPKTKFYYTVQFAFWIQQLFVLNIEKARKDHAQMFLHHVITIALLASSYIFNFTRVGTAVLCIMDIVDVLLPFAKVLKYLRLQRACDIAFGVFLVTWFVTRHVMFGIVLQSIYSESRHYVDFDWSPAEGKFWSHATQKLFLALLGSLQAILCVWFVMIVRVAWKVLTGSPANDTRSGSSDDDEVEEQDRTSIRENGQARLEEEKNR